MRTVLTPLVRGAACAAVVVLAGCGSNQPSSPVTVTVPPSTPRSTGTSTSGATGSSSPAVPGGSSASSGTGTKTKLNGTCESLLPDFLVTQALGVTQLAGTTAFVVGQPDKAIGRLGYLNCRYGITGTGTTAKAKVEIGVSLYATAQQATSRIGATVDGYHAHGAHSTPAAVGALTGTRLTGGVGVGYTVPLLVVASGQRTVAVSVDPAAAKGVDVNRGGVQLAALAVQRTAG